MAIQPISQIKVWFKKNCYPTEGQFADWIDSFWHKSESIPIASIADLTTVLNSKQDKATATDVDVSEIEVFDPAKVGGYLAGNTFVSYKNLASSDVAFHTASIYHCITNAAMGESPETHPAKWENQGTTITYTASSTCKTHVTLMSELATLTGVKVGDVVGVQQNSFYYKYNASSGWQPFTNFIWDIKTTTGSSTKAVMSQKAVTDLADTKVDKVAGKSLVSDSEIIRLAGINEHFRGTFTTPEALRASIPVGNAGDEAQVDAGIGSDPLRYVYDISDNSWKLGGGASQVYVHPSTHPASMIVANNGQTAQQKFDTIEVQMSANQLTGASIYMYYNFI